MEEWRDIDGYGGKYQVSSQGRIRSQKTVLKPQSHRSGYQIINLWLNNHRKAKLVHRVVAQTFIPNPLLKPQVNHINGDKTDNRVENLEWCTNGENQRHKLNVLCHRPLPETYHRCRVVCIETGETFNSISEAANSVGVAVSNIVAVCRHYRGCHTAAGFHWEYV